MNQQGVVWQELLLQRHYTNAAPQRSLLKRRKEPWAGAGGSTPSTARHARIQSMLEDRNRSRDGYRLRLRCAEGRDPLKKTETGRKAINAGIGIVVPIEDTADLMP
jgi:hypothetical protein